MYGKFVEKHEIKKAIPSDKLDKWVINLSDKELSTAHKQLLGKGLNFALTVTKIPTDDLIICTEQACRILKEDSADADELRAKTVDMIKKAKLPPSNISHEEKEALSDLRQDKTVIILPADKGRATVVMNRKDYEQKASQLLGDVNTYTELKKDPTSQYKKDLIAILQNLEKKGAISHILKLKLHPTSEDTPKFYGLPKIHKVGAPLRPIISCIGSISYHVAKFVANIISPLVGKNQYYIKNSKHFVNKISELTVGEDEEMVSYDVTALFTSTPIQEAVDVIKERLKNDETLSERTNLNVTQVVELLRFCLTSTYFIFKGTYYQQVEGAAMGSPVSPIVANLFMEHFEEVAISTAPNPPKFWGRFVDDTFVIQRKDKIEEFTTHINNINRAIKFTIERETDGKLPMLDTMIHRRPDGTLYATVYRKPTHTDLYLNFASHHPLQHKIGVVRTLTDRANVIVTEESDKTLEIEHIHNALSTCGYPDWLFHVSKEKRSKRTPANQTRVMRRGTVSIPYIKGISETLMRLYRSKGIQCQFKPINTIRRNLVAPKDKIKKLERSGTVYHIPCADCPATYVGESERPLSARLQEHKRPSYVSSPVVQHVAKQKHKIDWDNVKVLDQDSDWFSRGVREAIQIRRQRSTLNRDRGRHYLKPDFTV
ncbi:uncharacterized protein [Branchiostoma lanceolatum]|uniref:uncharacterized protein n=1 Tax=Branchiostoma lanceolatum TaxID=7740 RepID=UPI003452CE81